MGWQSYNLDQYAHDLVLKYRDKDVIKESHKMRVNATYGLERFWGEQLRLSGAKFEYWRDTWQALVEVMSYAGIKLPMLEIPNNQPSNVSTQEIQAIAKQLWEFPQEQRKVSLAVLIQLCDNLVWWTSAITRKSS